MRRVGVLGASGLVGAAVCEHLVAKGRDEVVPFIHSSGNAWRLARTGIELRSLDCRDRTKTAEAIRGCTHLVNCIRGDDEVMLRGLRNILRAAATNDVQGFVHLSSVAVFGDPPPPEAVTEDARRPRLPKRTYGRIKLDQDRIVAAAARAGLPAIILCPPNIGGPYSHFFNGIVRALRNDAIPRVEDGRTLCNLVDTANLAHAIDLALDQGSRTAPFFFVTDDDRVSWAQLLDQLLEATSSTSLPCISRAEAETLAGESTATRRSLFRSLAHLGSGEVRASLREDPLWADLERFVRQGIRRLGKGYEKRLKTTFGEPEAASPPPPRYSTALIRQQLRTVTHSCDRAKRILGYSPAISSEASIEAFLRCHRTEARIDSDWGELLEVLHE